MGVVYTINLSLGDDAYQQIQLQNGKTIPLFGASYSSLFVGSNGYITFGDGDASFTSLLSTHFSLPRISGFFADLNPSNGGTISVKQLDDRFVVAFVGIGEYASPTSNNFQIEMFFDGTIAITHLLTEAGDGIVGLSAGTGTPSGFASSDLSAAADCASLRLRNDFTNYDVSGDLRLTLAESGLDSAGFNALDTNQDGYFSMEELLAATVGFVGDSARAYADFDYIGTEVGTISNPFNTLFEAQAFVSTGGDVYIAPGASSEILTLNKAVTLLRQDSTGTVTFGAP